MRCFAVVRKSVPITMFIVHVIGGFSGDIQTTLREQHADWSSDAQFIAEQSCRNDL